MQSFYLVRRDQGSDNSALLDWLRRASLNQLAGGLLRLAATAFGAFSGFVFGFIFLHPLAFLGLPLGGVAAWHLTAWMTRHFVAAEATVADEKSTDHATSVPIYVGTGLVSGGILTPVLALPWLFGCTDECQAYGLSIVAGALIALIGATTLFFVADSATLGESRRPWKTLISHGWPHNPVNQFALIAIGLGVALYSALVGMPLYYIPPVALLVTCAATCLRGSVRLDDSSQRDIWTDDRILKQDFSFAIVTLWISLGVAGLLVAVGWPGISARL